MHVVTPSYITQAHLLRVAPGKAWSRGKTRGDWAVRVGTSGKALPEVIRLATTVWSHFSEITFMQAFYSCYIWFIVSLPFLFFSVYLYEAIPFVSIFGKLLSLFFYDKPSIDMQRVVSFHRLERVMLVAMPTFHGCQITSWVPWPAVIWNWIVLQGFGEERLLCKSQATDRLVDTVMPPF